MKFVVSCDIGEFGPKEGAAVTYDWKWYYSAAKLLPWFILLAAIGLLKDNRNIRILLILIPILILNLLWSIFLKILQITGEPAGIFSVIFNSFVTGTALLWLLGHKIGNRNRFAVFLLALAVMIVTGTVIFCFTTGSGFSASLLVFAIIYPVMTLSMLLSFALAGVGCRKSYNNVKFILLLSLWAMAVSFSGIFLSYALTITFVEDSVSIADVLFQIIIMGLATGVLLCIFLLPFMILAARSKFFGRRLFAYLQLKSMKQKIFKSRADESLSEEKEQKEPQST